MENQIQVFNNPQFGEVRTAGTADSPLFCLSDVCNAIGIHNARNVKNRLEKDDVHLVDTIDNLGRTQQVTFVTESGLYDVIIRSDSEQAKPFRKWVTSEVLPSIRKTGGYIATTQDDSPELIMARALQVAQSTIDRHKQMLQQANERITIQEQEIKKAAPKVQYVDNVLQSVNTYTSTQMSKELGLREAEQLHKILRERGVMFKQSGQWLLTAKYCGCEYTKPRTHSFTRNDGSTGTSTTTVWTEKGRAFLHTLFGA